jgi:hypothetical protein
MFCDSNMEAAATNLRRKLREIDRDFGMIGLGSGVFTIYVHGSAAQWRDKTFDNFHGYPIEWHFDVGRPELTSKDDHA